MNELEILESKLALLEKENEWLKEYVKFLESQVAYLNSQRPMVLQPWESGYHPNYHRNNISPAPYQTPGYLLSDNTLFELGDDVKKWADELASDVENLND